MTPRDNRKPIKVTEEVNVSALKPGYVLDAPHVVESTEEKEEEHLKRYANE